MTFTENRFKQHILRILAVMLLIAALVSASAVPAVYAETPDQSSISLYSQNATVYCTDTNTFLYDQNADARIYPASTTKILTAIVAIENAEDLDMKVTVSENAEYGIDPSSSHIALETGEELTLRQVLYGLLLASGNDCAVVIAEAVGGSIEGFSDMMNEKAAEIGCTDSHFSNPHGLFAEDHYTTVHDLCLIMAYAIQNETFVEIDSTLTYTIPATNKQEPRELWHGHGMLKNKYAYYEPVICGKTGYITESGFNLVTYGEKNGIHLIVATAGASQQGEDCKDTKALMEFFFNNYSLSTISVSADNADPIKLDEDTTIPVSLPESEVKCLVPAGEEDTAVTYETVPAEGLARPIAKGDQVGELVIRKNDTAIATLPLLSAEAFPEPGRALQGFARNLLTAAGIVIALVLLLLLIASIRRRKQRRSRMFLHSNGRRHRR